jgi:DNA-binding response OmpR family regulator
VARRHEDAAQPGPISREAADAVRAFQTQLRRLPLQSEIALDLTRHTASVTGEPRHLTPAEFGLLSALAAQTGQPVSRTELLAAGRERSLGEGSRAVDVHIAHLREKLALPGAITTVRGRGYALNPAFRVSLAS